MICNVSLAYNIVMINKVNEKVINFTEQLTKFKIQLEFAR